MKFTFAKVGKMWRLRQNGTEAVFTSRKQLMNVIRDRIFDKRYGFGAIERGTIVVEVNDEEILNANCTKP